MKKLAFTVIIVLAISSCKMEQHFEKYIGTWQPIYGENQQMIRRIQFMKLKNFYIAGIEYDMKRHKNQIFFYVCEKEKNYFVIRPNNYFWERSSHVYYLTRPTKIYHDPEFNNIYFSNFVFKSSPENIYELVNNELIVIDEE